MENYTFFLIFTLLCGGANSWSADVQKIEDRLAPSKNLFGYSLARNSKTLVVGSPGESDYGSIHIYNRTDNGFSLYQTIAKPEIGSSFGSCVTVGNHHIAVGDPQKNVNNGSVIIYQSFDEGYWIESATLSTEISGKSFGKSVVLAKDQLLVGSPSPSMLSPKGMVFFYSLGKDGRWNQFHNLTSQASSEGDEFGNSLAITTDATLAAISAPKYDQEFTNQGAVYIAEKKQQWTITQKIVARDATDNHNFGCVVAMSDRGIMIVGANFDSTKAIRGGAIYVFRKQEDGSFKETQKVYPPNPSADEFFGSSIDITRGGETLIVSLRNWNANPNKADAYVYRLNDNRYVLQEEISLSSSRKRWKAPTVNIYSYQDQGSKFTTLVGHPQPASYPRAEISVFPDVYDCKHVFEGSNKMDDCGICGGNNASCTGCDGVINSKIINDECGICGGDNSTCTGCDGIINSGKRMDVCGVCGGSDACLGCDGIFNSNKKMDACGICGGNNKDCKSKSVTQMNFTANTITVAPVQKDPNSEKKQLEPVPIVLARQVKVEESPDTEGLLKKGDAQEGMFRLSGSMSTCLPQDLIKNMTFGGKDKFQIVNCGDWCKKNISCTNLRYTVFNHNPLWDCRIENVTFRPKMTIRCRNCGNYERGMIDPTTCFVDLGMGIVTPKVRVLIMYIWVMFFSILSLVFVRQGYRHFFE